MLQRFRELVIKLNDKLQDWAVTRKLTQEKDPQKRFEVKLWLDISGAYLGGQGREAGWELYKLNHYNMLEFDDKNKVHACLLNMLHSDRYSIRNKAYISYICADLRLQKALPVVNDLLMHVKDDSLIKDFKWAQEALSRNITMHELVKEKFTATKSAGR